MNNKYNIISPEFLRRVESAEFRIFMASSDETPKTQAAREQFLTLDLKVRFTIFY